jgi:hypothetical protein
MTVTVDEEQRVTLPAQPGAVFEINETEGGQLVLTPLSQPESKVEYIRKDGLLLARRGRVITWAETRSLLDQFP